MIEDTLIRIAVALEKNADLLERTLAQRGLIASNLDAGAIAAVAEAAGQPAAVAPKTGKAKAVKPIALPDPEPEPEVEPELEPEEEELPARVVTKAEIRAFYTEATQAEEPRLTGVKEVYAEARRQFCGKLPNGNIGGFKELPDESNAEFLDFLKAGIAKLPA